MGPGVEPGIAAAHPFDAEQALVQVHLEQRGDLQLTPVRRFDPPGPLRRRAVEEVEPRHRVVRRRHRRFLDDLLGLAGGVELDHAIAFRIRDAIAEHRAADRLGIGLGQQVGQAVAEEDVVAQHHGRRRAGQEILGQQIGLRQTVRRGLDDVFEPHPPLAAVAQGALELLLVDRGGDHRDLADPGQHQHRDREIDHRLVVDRQQLLRDAPGDRIEPRARAARQNDALACGHRARTPRSSRMSRRPARQSGRSMPNTAFVAAQSSRELNGRRAGVG